MAIASQSLRNATDLEQGRKSISHRLIALGRAHDLLLQSHWVSARLPAIVHASIEPFETPHNKRFVVLGADIDVAPAGVLALAMALNELCTNAVKYGALSKPDGRVEIKSILDETAQRFKLIWEEKGGPVVKEPKRRSTSFSPISRHSAGSISRSTEITFGQGNCSKPASGPYETRAPSSSVRLSVRFGTDSAMTPLWRPLDGNCHDPSAVSASHSRCSAMTSHSFGSVDDRAALRHLAAPDDRGSRFSSACTGRSDPVIESMRAGAWAQAVHLRGMASVLQGVFCDRAMGIAKNLRTPWLEITGYGAPRRILRRLGLSRCSQRKAKGSSCPVPKPSSGMVHALVPLRGSVRTLRERRRRSGG